MKPINFTNPLIGIDFSYFAGFLTAALLCCGIAGLARAQKPDDKRSNEESCHAGHKTEENKSPPANKTRAKFVIPDVEVVTQDGKQIKFFTDLVKGKKVLINFIYTSCALTCPMAGRNFSKLQERLGKSSGEDVFLISVSTDPLTDTPSILKKWGEKFNRRDGWTLVTGEESKMKQLLLLLTGTGPQRGLHTSLLVLFDEKSGAWETSSSLIEPTLLLDNLSKLGNPPGN